MSDPRNHRSICLVRPLVNQRNVLEWLMGMGVRKTIPQDQMHLTMATVRDPVDWTGLTLRDDELVIPAGEKPVQIFAYTIKALTFGHPDIASRHQELLKLFPNMDHPVLRPHVSLYKGGRMPKGIYNGPLVFGPERATPFAEDRALGVQHVPIADALAGIQTTPKVRDGGRHANARRDRR